MSGGQAAPTHAQLFLGFAKMGLSGFGGVLPFARQVIVVEKAWVSERDFAELLGLGQVLPGPNIINVGVFIGTRFRGWSGAVAAVFGLIGPPLVILVAIAMVYDAIGTHPLTRAAIGAVAVAAAGLVAGLGAKMVARLKPPPAFAALTAAAFAGIALFGWPLVWVVAGLAPLGVWLGWRDLR